ncbi:4-hydroxy-3-methylbut-2-enyl diphosphate reductase [Nonomuraea terrae]|uniref:4-hydroxy-3-methylbut-2-enyl diphosphate reductase n=1 Tax=Nonomuraea terrae TaxID=2530383 RepID=UPI0037881A49
MASARKKVVLAQPRGFCAGVERAIAMVERALDLYGPPVYVRKEIVHNRHVVDRLEARGARFVDSEAEVPEGAICIFSAHGVSPQVRAQAESRRLDVVDATCPLVSKVHQQARRFARDDRVLLLIGHADHEEVEGIRGEAPERTIVVESAEDVDRLDLDPATAVGYVTQTTLAVDETSGIVSRVRERFPNLAEPSSETICYASQNRQNGIKSLAARCELVLVVGSENSSNSQRMVDVARDNGVRSFLVPDVSRLDERWLDGVTSVGVSSGASVPEVLVDQVLERLSAWGFHDIEVETGATEDVVFFMPMRLAEGGGAAP